MPLPLTLTVPVAGVAVVFCGLVPPGAPPLKSSPAPPEYAWAKDGTASPIRPIETTATT
jgi:hypothetical protein